MQIGKFCRWIIVVHRGCKKWLKSKLYLTCIRMLKAILFRLSIVLVVCTNHRFQVERICRNANCFGSLGRSVLVSCAALVFIVYTWMLCHLTVKYELHVHAKLFNFVAVCHLMFNSMPALFVRLWSIVRSKCGKQRSQWNWSATKWNLAEKELLSNGELAAEKQISSEF